MRSGNVCGYLHLTILIITGMGYRKFERQMPVCLECGDKIRYGRTDKKYCCDECRTRHHNALARDSRAFRRRVMKVLSRNHEILMGLLRADIDSIDLMDILNMGFTPSVVTSYRKCGRHDEYACFDIKFIMTGTRVYSISKIQNFE